MKSKLIFTSLFAACMALPIASHSADDRDKDRSSPKVFVKDSIITTKIKAQIAATMSYKDHIKVDTDAKGAVLLSGNAKSQADVAQIESIARGVKGVMSVENRIQVKADM